MSYADELCGGAFGEEGVVDRTIVKKGEVSPKKFSGLRDTEQGK